MSEGACDGAHRLGGGRPRVGRGSVKVRLLAVLALCAVPVVAASPASAATTDRVSVSSFGEQANNSSVQAAVSGDGSVVAFLSIASNLVADDTNNLADVFVREGALTTRVNVSSSGDEANGRLPRRPVVSADGRVVVFSSTATNLVAGDTNGQQDVFAHDRVSGQTTRVNVGSSGDEASSVSGEPAISARRTRRRVHLPGEQPRCRRHQRTAGRVRSRPGERANHTRKREQLRRRSQRRHRRSSDQRRRTRCRVHVLGEQPRHGRHGRMSK